MPFLASSTILTTGQSRRSEYDAVFYMDSDMLVVKPFQEIWSFPAPFASARDVRMGV